MRIITGKYKGRIIPETALPHTRPTTDFARTGLFSMLEHRMNLEGIKALDLFSGTGSIGFELLSRGCEQVTMVDSDNRSILHLKKTAELLQVSNAVIVKAEVMRFLKSDKMLFDLVIADPPFYTDFEIYENLIQLVMNRAVQKNGIFILEHHPSVNFETMEHFKESRRFGNVAFSFFAKKSES